MRFHRLKRREFIAMLGSAAAWPFAARAQQSAMPVVAFISGGSSNFFGRSLAAFQKGLTENGYIEGRNVAIEYHWLEGRYNQVAELVADLVRRQVTVIATPATLQAALAAKAATNTIPIVFGIAQDPTRVGLVTSLARPGGNATGVNFFNTELIAKRLQLLHDLVPSAVRIAVMVNPANSPTAESTLREVQEAAPGMGLQIHMKLSAGTAHAIDAAFAAIELEHPDALFVAPDTFFLSRAVQFATSAARARIPAAYAGREWVEAGGLMSYGTDFTEMNYQIGVYAGKILKGTKPAELPVLQSTKFEFILNGQIARTLGIEVRSGILSIADEVIE